MICLIFAVLPVGLMSFIYIATFNPGGEGALRNIQNSLEALEFISPWGVPVEYPQAVWDRRCMGF